MKQWILIFTLLFSSLEVLAHAGHSHAPADKMVAHLSFAKEAVHAHLYWDKAPDMANAAVLRVEFRRASDHAYTGINADLSVRATMPEMDHGDIPTAPPTQKLDEQGNPVLGVYTVDNIFFYMSGRWEVILTLTSTDGSQESQSFEVFMEGDSGHHHHH